MLVSLRRKIGSFAEVWRTFRLFPEFCMGDEIAVSENRRIINSPKVYYVSYLSFQRNIMEYHLQPIPTLNARHEFELYRKVTGKEKFWEEMLDCEVRDLNAGKFLWGNKQEGVTVMVQRVVLGIESYIKGAVYIQLGYRNILTKEKVEKLSDPFTLGGAKSNTADVYFNRIPLLVDEKLQLRVSNQKLWKLTKEFYKKLRNPIFHGHFFSKIQKVELEEIFTHFEKLYKWIDEWCPISDNINTMLKRANDLHRISDGVKVLRPANSDRVQEP